MKVAGPCDLLKTVKRQKLFVNVEPKPGTSKEGNNKFHKAGVEYNWLCMSCPAAFQSEDHRDQHTVMCKGLVSVKKLSPIKLKKDDCPRCEHCQRKGCWGECMIISGNVGTDKQDGFGFATSDNDYHRNCSNCLHDGCWGECVLRRKGTGKTRKK